MGRAMRNRHLHIAVVFVWALAHGVWMGAGMHSFAALGTRSETANNGGRGAICASCVRFDTPTISDVSLRSSDPCAVCKLSTVLPELAQVHTFVASGALPVHSSPASLEEIDRSFTAHLFPLAHAPPV